MRIKIESTDKELSAHAGLVFFKELIEKTKLSMRLVGCVPSLKFGSAKNIRKFKQLMLAFEAGADCLDDIDKLALDPGFVAACGGKVYSSKACGDLLRDFTAAQCKSLNHMLIKNAFGLREETIGRTESITVDIDSTSNQQYGKQMEGVERSYKGIDCLDTIQAFDEYGIQYWNDVRPGRTHTASGSLEIIHEIFSRMPTDGIYEYTRRYLRADRGYCKVDLFNACMAKNVGFVVGLRQLMLRPLISRITTWHQEDPNRKDRIIFQGNRECEVGETVYQPKQSPHIFRVVAIRAPKVGRENQLVLGAEDYDYYGWVTSIGYSEMSARKIVIFYRNRGNAENYVKEVKNAMDMHHYPCQKLLANKAYGLVAAFAYNLMRFMALMANKKKPQFSKAIRFYFVHLPCQVVSHGREVIFRFMKRHVKEVEYWLKRIQKLQFRFI